MGIYMSLDLRILNSFEIKRILDFFRDFWLFVKNKFSNALSKLTGRFMNFCKQKQTVIKFICLVNSSLTASSPSYISRSTQTKKKLDHKSIPKGIPDRPKFHAIKFPSIARKTRSQEFTIAGHGFSFTLFASFHIYALHLPLHSPK